VQCRIRTAFPIGSELSGGIDSSSITGAASHCLRKEGKNLITFSNMLDPDEIKNEHLPWEDERKYAEAVIKYNEIQEFVFVSKNIWDNPIDEVDFSLKINDGPEMRSQLWLLPIKQAAMKKRVRTLLSGFPGDEMVTYRGYYYFLDYLDEKKYFKYLHTNFNWKFKLKAFLPADVEFIFHKLANIARFNHRQAKDIFTFYKLPPYYRFNMGDVAWKDNEYRERFKSYRHYQKYMLLKPQVALRMEGETRFGLTYKMESRYPMADIRLTQYCLSLPNHLKSEGSISRSAFRNAVRDYLPIAIFERDNKSGRIIPFRATPNNRKKNRATLTELINSGAYPFIKNNLSLLQSNSKLIVPYHLETIRWFENNFENL